MTALRWILGALLVLAALLLLSGSELRLHGPAVAKICDPPCTGALVCNSKTGKCEGSAAGKQTAPVCLPPAPEPHGGALEIWLQQKQQGEPDLFEQAER